MSTAVASAEMISVDGIPLRVIRSGDGSTEQSPPLLLVNGLGAGLELWDPLLERIEGREVIAFDLPGAGKSGHRQLPQRVRGIAAAVAAMLDELGCGRVDLLGYSLGGIVAQEIAHRHPERVRKLILVATSPGLPSVPPDPLAAAVMLTPARYYDRRFAEMTIPIIAGGRTARDRAVMRRGVDRRLLEPPTLTGYLHQLFAVWGWSSHRWLRKLPQPTLVLNGDEDPLVPLVNARYLAWTIPDATLHVVDGAGHMVLIDQPDDALEAILPFLDRPMSRSGFSTHTKGAK